MKISGTGGAPCLIDGIVVLAERSGDSADHCLTRG